MAKAAAVYIDDEVAKLLKALAALQGITVAQLVREAFASHLRFGARTGATASQDSDVRDSVSAVMASLSAHFGSVGLSAKTRPVDIIEEDWCAGSDLLLFSGWTLENLITVAYDRLVARLDEDCRLQFLLADPLEINSAFDDHDLKEAILRSLIRIRELEQHSATSSELIEVRFHPGSAHHTISKAVRRDSGDVEVLVDLRPYRCQVEERLRLSFDGQVDFWAKQFADSVDRLWNDASQHDWHKWVEDGYIPEALATE